MFIKAKMQHYHHSSFHLSELFGPNSLKVLIMARKIASLLSFTF